MRFRNRRWTFIAALAGATLVQGTGAKLVGQLIRGTLPTAGVVALVVLAAAYLLLVVGLVRMLAGERQAAAGDERGLARLESGRRTDVRAHGCRGRAPVQQFE